MVQHVNGQTLEELIKGDKPVFCDFWATWCAPCRMLAPAYEELAEKYKERAVFVKIDVDENTDAAILYKVSSIPNITVFKGGQPTAKHLGFVPIDALEKFITENL